MSDDDLLPTDFIIGATIRRAAQEGVPIVVRQRGDNARGTLVLKINLLDGTARVLTQGRSGDTQIWIPAGKTDPMPDAAAESTLAQATFTVSRFGSTVNPVTLHFSASGTATPGPGSRG